MLRSGINFDVLLVFNTISLFYKMKLCWTDNYGLQNNPFHDSSLK
jgi:hypothetical protein